MLPVSVFWLDEVDCRCVSAQVSSPVSENTQAFWDNFVFVLFGPGGRNFEGKKTNSRVDGAEFDRDLVFWVGEDLLQFSESCFLDVLFLFFMCLSLLFG